MVPFTGHIWQIRGIPEKKPMRRVYIKIIKNSSLNAYFASTLQNSKTL
jgi:hypothetical protein